MTAYIGHLSTTSGDGPEVAIKIDGASVCVLTPDERSHVWPAPLIKVTGVSSPRFWITFDDELAVFTAHHPSKFLFEFVPALRDAQELARRQGFVPGTRRPARPAQEDTRSDRPAEPEQRHTTPPPEHGTAAQSGSQAAGEESRTEPRRRKRHVTPGSTLPPRRRSMGRRPAAEETTPAATEPTVPGPSAHRPHSTTAEPPARAAHWQQEAGPVPSQVLSILAELHQHATEPAPEPLPPEPAEAAPVAAPGSMVRAEPPARRRWWSRKRTCDHDWQPRVIGGHEGHICVICFDVTFDLPVESPPPAAAETAESNGDHLVIDLTDQALADDLVDAQPRPLLERLAEQNLRDRYHRQAPPPTDR